MAAKTVTFRILRYKPNRIDPPRYQDFALQIEPDMSVLDALEKIRLERDNTLMYRHSCHHSSCGTCACKINGRERLTCITKISDLQEDTITLTPLEGFKPIGDLVVDMHRFYEEYSAEWHYLRRSEKIKSKRHPAGIEHFTRFENCIECGACISACPATHNSNAFLGPAVLAAVNNELKKSPQKSADLLTMVGSNRGERLCERAVNCSRVCPNKVYPARQIADLRRMREKRDIEGIKYYSPIEEKINIISHAIGFLLSIVVLAILVTHANLHGDVWHIVSFSIFGASLIILYAASTFYHSAKKPELRNRLKIMDHASIYVLIAGTYTPFTLVTLKGKIGWVIFGISWGLALTGIILKIFFSGKYNLISTIMYVLMGWAIVFAMKPLITNLPLEGLLWLFAGGISYTIGAILYSIKKIKFNHAIFHMFVLMGSFCHFMSVFFYVLPSE